MPALASLAFRSAPSTVLAYSSTRRPMVSISMVQAFQSQRRGLDPLRQGFELLGIVAGQRRPGFAREELSVTAGETGLAQEGCIGVQALEALQRHAGFGLGRDADEGDLKQVDLFEQGRPSDRTWRASALWHAVANRYAAKILRPQQRQRLPAALNA